MILLLRAMVSGNDDDILICSKALPALLQHGNRHDTWLAMAPGRIKVADALSLRDEIAEDYVMSDK